MRSREGLLLEKIRNLREMHRELVKINSNGNRKAAEEGTLSIHKESRSELEDLESEERDGIIRCVEREVRSWSIAKKYDYDKAMKQAIKIVRDSLKSK